MMETSSSNTVDDASGFLSRLGGALADWSLRWFPDGFVFALLALVIVFLGGLLAGSSPRDLVGYFGQGFWSLIPFTMQMAMTIVGGYVVATSAPAHALIRRLARIPHTPKAAVAFVGLFSLLTSLLSWGVSLIFSGLLVREIVKRLPATDYRAIGAAAYLGMGSVWALGLSSSATLLMATPSAIPAGLLKISGVIPLGQTLCLWQNAALAAILVCSGVLVAYLSAPASSTRTAAWYGVTEDEPITHEKRQTPGEWLEYSPILPVVVAVIGLAYLGHVLRLRGPLAALDLNTYNLLFLMLGLLLHWRPRSFVRAVNNAIPSTAGVLIQFPFYGGIFGIVTMSAISTQMAHLFVRISSHGTYPILVSLYSALLGVFVPSGGSKWIIEAPYVLQAAKDLHVHLGWMIQTYNASEALPNLINPFWMLPLLGILKVRARDLVGFGLLQLIVNSILVLTFVWLFSATLPYVAPNLP